MDVWSVIQPTSPIHANRSSGWMSTTHVTINLRRRGIHRWYARPRTLKTDFSPDILQGLAETNLDTAKTVGKYLVDLASDSVVNVSFDWCHHRAVPNLIEAALALIVDEYTEPDVEMKVRAYVVIYRAIISSSTLRDTVPKLDFTSAIRPSSVDRLGDMPKEIEFLRDEAGAILPRVDLSSGLHG